jgi:hypothetical protein
MTNKMEEAQPDFWAYHPKPPHHKRDGSMYTRNQLTTAITAARVQALEEAANPTDDQLVKGVKAMRLFVTKNSVADFKKGYVAAIRELIGDKSET